MPCLLSSAVLCARAVGRFACVFVSIRRRLTRDRPELVPYLKVLVGTVNDRTRLMQEVEFDPDQQ
jgi:hypothetical protein